MTKEEIITIVEDLIEFAKENYNSFTTIANDGDIDCVVQGEKLINELQNDNIKISE